MASTKLGLESLQNNASNQTLANLNFALLNQLVQAAVLDKDLSTPPASPANESLYIVAASATGAWAGQDSKLAYWLSDANAWTFIAPRAGYSVRVLDETEASGLPLVYGYTGSAWTKRDSSGGGGDAGMDNPMTTAGDLIVGGASGSPSRLGKGTDGQVLKMVSGSPAWGTDDSGGSGGGFSPLPISDSAIKNSRNFAIGDANKYFRGATNSDITLTIPAQESVNFQNGTEIAIEQSAAGKILIVSSGNASVSPPIGFLAKTRAVNSVIRIKKISDYNWIVEGDLEVDSENYVAPGSPVKTVTSDRSLRLTDCSSTLLMNRNSADALTITIPSQSSVAFPNSAEVIAIQFGSSPVQIAAASGVTLYKMPSYNAKVAGQYGRVVLKRIAEDVWLLSGELEHQ